MTVNPGLAFGDEREPPEGFGVSGGDEQLPRSAGDQPSGPPVTSSTMLTTLLPGVVPGVR